MFGCLLFTACNKATAVEYYYDVTFNYQTSAISTKINVKKDSLISSPVLPAREHFSFVGWYKEKECVNPWDFAYDKVISEITLYAKWKEHPHILYNVNGGSGDIIQKVYAPSESPANLSLQDYTFITKPGFQCVGWNTQKNGFGNTLQGSVFVEDKLTLFAKWEQIIVVGQPNYTNFLTILGRISNLEQLAKEYIAETQKLVTSGMLIANYVRADTPAYNNSIYNTPNGAVDAEFNEYVESYQGNTGVSDLKTLQRMILPNGEEVDFIKLFAAMGSNLRNGVDSHGARYSGWLGDIANLTIEIYNETGNSLDAGIYYDNSKIMLNNETSVFNKYKVLADIDAVNLIQLRVNENKSLTFAENFEKYYTKVTIDRTFNRYNKFIEFSSLQSADGILQTLRNNTYVIQLLSRGMGYKLNPANSNEELAVKAVIQSFAEFIFTIN